MNKIIIDGEEYMKKTDCKKVVVNHESDNPFMELGECYFIRTVTHYFTGRLIWVGEKELVLEDVCWIADTGRFNEFVKGGVGNETEPFPKGKSVIIGRGSIIDMVEHDLILGVK